MKRPVRALAQSIVVAALVVASSAVLAAQSAAPDEEALMKDLTAVIALQGLPCGPVVAVTVEAENDYVASCKDENRYRVFVNDAGRVVVEKQKVEKQK
jgi:hypothetical protein